MPRPEIVVIGGSAGGIEPLKRLLAALPRQFPGPILVVIHTSPESVGTLPQVLRRDVDLPVIFPSDGEILKPGYVYVAPPDYHLLVSRNRAMISNGPRENGFRPAIDPLFRSAARAFDGRTVGIVLSGALDDGTFGLLTIKQVGGTAIVQHPDEALVSSMPLSAIQNVEVDHIVRAQDLAPLLLRLFDGEAPMTPKQPSGVRAGGESSRPEPDITVHGPDALIGPPSIYNCPECGGVMWELQEGGLFRFRCHTGHGFTPESLLAEQNGKLENAMWSAVRVLRERAALYRQLAGKMHARHRGQGSLADTYHAKAEEEEAKATQIENVLSQTLTTGIEDPIPRLFSEPESEPPGGQHTERAG